MTIDIPGEYEDILRQAVASGAYANREDALKHAMELFAAEQSKGLAEEADRQKRHCWDERNAASIQQSNQGISNPLDPQAVVDRLHARLADNETRH